VVFRRGSDHGAWPACRRGTEALAAQNAGQPGGRGDVRPQRPEPRRQLPVVGDHEGAGRAGRHEIAEDGVGAAATPVADLDTGTQVAFAGPRGRGAVEHDDEADGGRDQCAKAADDRRRWKWDRVTQRVQQVRAIDQHAGGGLERVGAAPRHALIMTGSRQAATIRGMLLLVDLDGVVYRGATPVPGVASVLAARAAAGDTIVYVTNNSMHYRADYVDRLSAMGAPVAADRVISSGRAAALWLAGQVPPPGRVLVVGGGGLERECRDVGLEVVTTASAAARAAADGIDGWTAAGRPDVVLVGLDPQLTYARLAVGLDCIRAGARFVATNRDPIFPSEQGVRPGAGAIVAALEASSGVEPVSIGKPGPLLFSLAIQAVTGRLADAVMIGDGVATDLAAARALGIPCILMLTGVTSRGQAERLLPAERPAALAADAAELAAAIDRLAAGAVA